MDKDIPLFMQTKSDLDEIENEYSEFQNNIINYMNEKGITTKEIIKPIKNNKGFSNIIICTMIILTIIIITAIIIGIVADFCPVAGIGCANTSESAAKADIAPPKTPSNINAAITIAIILITFLLSIF